MGVFHRGVALASLQLPQHQDRGPSNVDHLMQSLSYLHKFESKRTWAMSNIVREGPVLSNSLLLSILNYN